MVVQGNFSLELINANTMEAFPEHSSSMGKTFVTVSPNVDFMVRLTAQGVPDERPIFYQTLVSANGRPRHNFKRRLLDADSFQFSSNSSNSKDQRNIFRFDRTKTSTYESVVMEKVTVRIYEGSNTSAANTNKEEEPTRQQQRRKLLETITIHCCVLPSHLHYSDSSSLSSFSTTSNTSLLSLLSLAASAKSQTQIKGRSNSLNNSMNDDLSSSSLVSSASRITPEKLLPKKTRRLVL